MLLESNTAKTHTQHHRKTQIHYHFDILWVYSEDRFRKFRVQEATTNYNQQHTLESLNREKTIFWEEMTEETKTNLTNNKKTKIKPKVSWNVVIFCVVSLCAHFRRCTLLIGCLFCGSWKRKFLLQIDTRCFLVGCGYDDYGRLWGHDVCNLTPIYLCFKQTKNLFFNTFCSFY